MNNYIKITVDKTFNLIELANDLKDLRTIYNLNYFNTMFDENNYLKIRGTDLNYTSLFHLYIYTSFMIYRNNEKKTNEIKRKKILMHSDYIEYTNHYTKWIGSLNRSLIEEVNFREELDKLVFALGEKIKMKYQKKSHLRRNGK